MKSKEALERKQLKQKLKFKLRKKIWDSLSNEQQFQNAWEYMQELMNEGNRI